MNKATRILTNMIPQERETITTALGEISDDADLNRQAQYINDLLNLADTQNCPCKIPCESAVETVCRKRSFVWQKRFTTGRLLLRNF